MPDARLQIRLEGSRADDGLVRAGDFVAALQAALKCLRGISAGTRPGGEVVARIAQLQIGSALVELLVSDAEGAPETALTSVVEFRRGVEAMKTGRLRQAGFEPSVEAAFGDLAAVLRKNTRSLAISTDGESVALTTATTVRELSPEIASMSVGAFYGRVDAVNVHSGGVFYLYPVAGPTRVQCLFDESQHLESVRAAIKSFVRVDGLLEYTADSPFPRRINVHSLQSLTPREGRRTLASFVGILPNLTGGKDSVLYVREQRNAAE